MRYAINQWRIKMQIHMKEMLKSMGFHVVNTGGGCQGYELSLPNGLSILVTDGEAQITDDVNVNPTIVFEDGENGKYVVVEGSVV
jgi:hypothetical protein